MNKMEGVVSAPNIRKSGIKFKAVYSTDSPTSMRNRSRVIKDFEAYKTRAMAMINEHSVDASTFLKYLAYAMIMTQECVNGTHSTEAHPGTIKIGD